MKFNITALMTVSIYTEIEAETIEEALKLAGQRKDYMSIASNNGDDKSEVWMIEDMDGTPFDFYHE